MSTVRTRCAIYTRKSSDEGLEQSFNSLDAQHEACAAYIASQRHEGWVLDRARYDDGGVSGGSLDRPALQRMLADIDRGRIRMIVVYKIDRLTRSLTDFAKLVDRLDAAGCSFVSVTQAFNTASSMGRLTLNVLLSFAQFEREVTAERIRDKIAASKKKGLWMGGLAPLGYEPHPDANTRGLVVNVHEAKAVQRLFEMYAKFGRLSEVAKLAEAEGIRSKRRVFASGRQQGGSVLSRGQIHHILTNPIYCGKIRHKDQIFDGQHEAIIEQALWDRVLVEREASNRSGPRTTMAPRSVPAPLQGKLRDETGDRLTPSHTNRREKRLRYYVSHRQIAKGPDPAGWRLPAPELERAVAAAIADHIKACAERHALVETETISDTTATRAAAEQLVSDLRSERHSHLRALVESGIVGNGRLWLVINRDTVATQLGVEPKRVASDALKIEVPFAIRRRGVEAKLIVGPRAPTPDLTLIRALADAHRWAGALKSGTPLKQIAAAAGKTEALVRIRTRLAFLAPSTQQAILDGVQPPDLTLEKLVRRPLALNWRDQEPAMVQR